MQGRAPSVRLDEADRDVDTSPLVISDDEDPHSCHPRPTQAAHDRRMSCSCRVSERKQTTALLLTVTCFLFMDQSLLAPHLTDVAVFFNYTDTQRDTKLGGELSFSLFLVGAPAAIVVGHLADRLNRRNLYTSVVLLGELGCFLVVFVRHYWQLFLLRALTGIALGGAVPLVFSILSDLYSSDERPPVAALVGVAAGAGAGIGQGVSAVVGQAYGWRAPFALVAVPSCVFALIFRFFAAEPRRGSQERREHSPNEIVSESAEFSSALRLGRQENAQMGADFGRAGKHEVRGGGAASLRQILERRSNLIIFLQGMPGCVPWSVILVYLNDYLVEDRGAPTKLAAVVVCTGWGVGATVGQLVGGWAGQRLLRSAAHQRGRICYMMGCSTVLAVVPLLLVLNCEFGYYLTGIAFMGGCLSGVTGPNVKAVLLNCNTPATRGRAFALQTLTDDIGKGLGPPLVSAIIVASGRHRAFNISALFWCVCGILLLLLSRTMGDDEAQVAAAAASTGADWAEQEGGCRAKSETCPGSGDFVRD